MRWMRWWRGVVALGVLALAACGGTDGSGGSSGGGGSSASRDDARNGDYTVFAADARAYTLSLDFDRRSWRLRGDALDQSGAFSSDGGSFSFQSTAVVTGTNTARFQTATDAVVGGLRLGSAVLPFVAARSFVASIAEAAGVYHFLERTVDATAAPSSAIFQGEITAGGQLRTCGDATIHAIANCPSASVVTSTLTLADTQFTAAGAGGSFSFRIAKLGSDRVLLRAGPSTGSARRFWIAMPATSAFASGSFAGANTNGQWSTATLNATTHSASLLSEAGGTLTRAGTSQPVGDSASGLASLLRLAVPNSANHFAIRNGALAAVVSAPDSTNAPGFLEILRAQ
jgi:hypothetical protein